MMGSFLKAGGLYTFAVYKHHGPYEERLRRFTVQVKNVGGAYAQCEARTATGEVYNFQIGSTWKLHEVKHHANTWFLPDRIINMIGFTTCETFQLYV
jgi:hypothetical protein